MCWAQWLLNMCLHQATRWTCPRPGLWTLTLTPRPGVYWTPGTSNVNRPLSTVRRAHCQNSTHSAEVIMQPTGIDFPSYDYLTIIIIITYYYCWHCILLFSHSTFMLNTPAFCVFLLAPHLYLTWPVTICQSSCIYTVAPVCVNHHWWSLP